MADWKKSARHAACDVRTFLKWMAIAAAVGLTVGAAGVAFHFCMEFAGAARQSHDWLYWLLPAAGAAIALLYRACGIQEDKGTNLVITSVRSTEPISIKTAPLIFAATFLTHLVGGSSGREGAALQLGGSMAQQLGRWLHLDEKDERIITMCGMSAAFSALFGTPVAAAIFSMEVISVGIMHYSAIVPCVAASLIGHGLALLCGVLPTSFPLEEVPAFTLLTSGRVLLLAALCAALSVVFCKLLHGFVRLYQRLLPNQVLRGAVGGALVLLLTLLVGVRDYNGAGVDVIRAATAGEARPEAFLLKMLFTAVTLGAGFKGGEIVPTFFVGATFGCVVGGLVGLPPSFGAAVGLVALFCGVVNCPVTSLLMGIELFGDGGLLYFALAVGVSYMLSGYYGLYSGQKILYSKFKPEYINENSK
jgi:H+/Cl- antiporter ClcA